MNRTRAWMALAIASTALGILRCGGSETSGTTDVPAGAAGEGGAAAGASSFAGSAGATSAGAAGAPGGSGGFAGSGKGGAGSGASGAGTGGVSGAGNAGASGAGAAGGSGAAGASGGAAGKGGAAGANAGNGGAAAGNSGAAGTGTGGAAGAAGTGNGGAAGATAGSGGAAEAGNGGAAGAGIGGAAGATAGSGGESGSAGGGGAGGPVCNGAAAFCERPYNQVAVACTHNAMSSSVYGFVAPIPNQKRSFTQQLDDGVRCLMLDTYAYMGDLYLCHGSCGAWGAMPMKKGLDEIAAWMSAHPTDVVTFILEAYISEADTLKALAASGLASADGLADPTRPLYVHAKPPGSPWPTLGEMIAKNQRLVVFTDDGKANGQWHLDWRTYGWETPYDDPTWSCAVNRGNPTLYDNQVFVLNHFDTGPIGADEATATAANAYPLLLDHAARCWTKDAKLNPFAQIPTFVTVDHYHAPTAGGPSPRADVFDVVDALNASWPTPLPP